MPIPSEFVPLHVHYRRDRAIRRAGAQAELLYIRGLVHAKVADSGGRIEDYDLPLIADGITDSDDAVRQLTSNALWVEDGQGWLIRSWEKWNGGADRSADGVRGNHVRWHVGRGVVVEECPLCRPDIAPDDRPRIAPDDRPESPGESQSRVEESREEEIGGDENVATLHAAHEKPKAPKFPIPEAWTPSSSNIRYAQQNGIDVEHEAGKFRAHHESKDSRFVNWDKAFRTWLGNCVDYRKPAPVRAEKPLIDAIPATEAPDDPDYIPATAYYANWGTDR